MTKQTDTIRFSNGSTVSFKLERVHPFFEDPFKGCENDWWYMERFVLTKEEFEKVKPYLSTKSI